VVRVGFAVVVSALMLALTAGSAFAGPAGSTAASGYGGEANVQSQVAGTAVAGAAQGALPFTGLDLTLVALAGATLVGLGVFVRRRASERAE
jgi:hypothetical protein